MKKMIWLLVIVTGLFSCDEVLPPLDEKENHTNDFLSMERDIGLCDMDWIQNRSKEVASTFLDESDIRYKSMIIDSIKIDHICVICWGCQSGWVIQADFHEDDIEAAKALGFMEN